MPIFDAILEAVQLMSYAMLLLIIAPLFPFLYVVMRWRASGNAHSGIGTLGAVHYFIVMSALLLLAGAANLSYGGVSVTPDKPEMTRISWGVFVSSVVFLVLNFGMLGFNLAKDLLLVGPVLEETRRCAPGGRTRYDRVKHVDRELAPRIILVHADHPTTRLLCRVPVTLVENRFHHMPTNDDANVLGEQMLHFGTSHTRHPS